MQVGITEEMVAAAEMAAVAVPVVVVGFKTVNQGPHQAVAVVVLEE